MRIRDFFYLLISPIEQLHNYTRIFLPSDNFRKKISAYADIITNVFLNDLISLTN